MRRSIDWQGSRARRALVEALEPRALLTATPVTWFHADAIVAANGDPVSVWADSSGSGNSATQTTAAHDPTYLADAINGQPAVHFDASASTQLAFARPVSGDFTLMVTFRSKQGLTHLQSWFNAAGLVDGDVPGVQSDFGLSLNSLGQVLGGTGAPDTTVASAMRFNDGNPHVATFERTQATGTISIYVDGRLWKQATAGTEPLTAPPRLTIGSGQNNTNYFTGDIADVRIYASPLSDADRSAVEGQLDQQYGIAPLPTNYFTNPVINADFADPGVLEVGRSYYAFATNTSGSPSNVQAAQSNDLVHWTMLPDALPTLPAWAQAGLTWAPDAALMPDGIHYNLYFTARFASAGRQAIGVATSTDPAGPFAPVGTAPLVAQSPQGGAIDPSVFTDTDGKQYLLWKNDGNAVGQATNLYIQQLSSDGLSLLGTPTALIKNDQRWEGSVVEAPTLWKHDGKYDLFYSGGSFNDASYAIGYAQSASLLGPYVKPAAPIVKSENGVVGPGGEDIVIGPDGNTWMVWASWEQNISYRSMSIDRLDWFNDVPVVRGPSRFPQPAPVYTQAPPVLTVARSDASGAHASGTLQSLPNTRFTVTFFKTSGTTATQVGSTTLMTDASGAGRFVDVPLSSVAVGQILTATATDPIEETSVPSAAIPVRLTGDLTGDNSVGFADLLLLAQNYGSSGANPTGDVNGDGRVDFTDLLLLAQHYGTSVPATASGSIASTALDEQVLKVRMRRRILVQVV